MIRLCARCGAVIAHGASAFNLLVALIADVDSKVQPLTTDQVDALIARILKSLARTKKQQLENQVYQARQFLLCQQCRDYYITDPFGISTPVRGSDLPPEE